MGVGTGWWVFDRPASRDPVAWLALTAGVVGAAIAVATGRSTVVVVVEALGAAFAAALVVGTVRGYRRGRAPQG